MKICHKSFVVVLLFYTFLLVACESINEPKQENLGIQTPSLPTNMPTQTVISTTIPASNQPATPTLNSTPFSAEVDMGLLFFARYEYYGWFDLMAQDSAHGLIFDNLDEYHKFSSQELLRGPGQSIYQVFSHYSDQIAYWTATTPGELWVSDVTYQNPTLILNDSEGSYVPKDENARLSPQQYIEIVWSPDDLHLFLYNRHKPELSKGYHLETNKVENWYWQCDSLILSSKTGRLATLCPKREESSIAEEYAVLEWGGEIWFSRTLPGELFIEPLADGTSLWQWSADGEWLAYFDPTDQEDHLLISDSEGNIRRLLSGSSLFRRVEGLDFQQYRYFGNENPFRWSRNGNLLLFSGLGQPDQPCPQLVDEEYGTGLSFDWHCWQLVDVGTGNIIWNEADLTRHLFPSEGEEQLLSMGVKDITFAPNSRAIAAHTTYVRPLLVIIDIQNFQPTVVNEYDRFDHIYWGIDLDN